MFRWNQKYEVNLKWMWCTRVEIYSENGHRKKIKYYLTDHKFSERSKSQEVAGSQGHFIFKDILLAYFEFVF